MQMNSNPYPKGTKSRKIFDRNYIDPGEKILSADERDRYIIYMSIMGKSQAVISRTMKLSVSTVNTVLLKYGIK